MQRVSVHISDESKQRISLAARSKKKVEAELIREAIDAGLDVIYPKLRSAKALVDLAKMAKGQPFHPHDPTDISEDSAKYAFGEKDA